MVTDVQRNLLPVLKTVAEDSSETLAITYQTTPQCNQKDQNPNIVSALKTEAEDYPKFLQSPTRLQDGINQNYTIQT
jgi:hypothetical protein